MKYLENTMKFNKYYKRIMITACLAIVVAVVIISVLSKQAYKTPFDDDIASIRISQETKSDIVTVEDTDAFIEKMEPEKWTEIEKFTLKSAPIYYLELSPSGKTIEIFMEDGECAYACFDGTYYSISVEAYECIEKIIEG